MIDVVIVGAGLAGLACAQDLVKAGVHCQVVEASDGLGGRVRTDEVDGYQLPRCSSGSISTRSSSACSNPAHWFERCADRCSFRKLPSPPIGSLVDKARLARLILGWRTPGSRVGSSSRSGSRCSRVSSWIRCSRYRVDVST